MRTVWLSLAIFALTAFPARAEDIKIGLAAALTGNIAAIGEQMSVGAEQAVSDINAAGGINGNKLVLVKGDDACDPKQAITVAGQMASAGVKFVVGHACSGTSIAASKVYSEENILMMTPTSTQPELTEAGLTNVFRICGRDDQEAPAQLQYFLKHFAGKKIAIVWDSSAGQRSMGEQFKKELNAAGVKEVFSEQYTTGEKDFSALITKLKQNGIQVLDIAGYYTEAALITRQIKQQGLDTQVIGDDAVATPEFWSITGPAGEGVLMSFQPDVTKRADAKSVVDRIQKSGHESGSYVLYTYAAVQAYAEAIRHAGTDPRKVATALRQAPISTLLGNINFDAKGDAVGSSYVIYRWHDGKYIEAENQ